MGYGSSLKVEAALVQPSGAAQQTEDWWLRGLHVLVVWRIKQERVVAVCCNKKEGELV